MSLHRVYLGQLTIPNAGTDSNVLGAPELSMARSLVLYTPAALTGTVSVRTGPKEDNTFAQTSITTIGGSDFTVAAARSEVVDAPVGAKSIAVVSSVAEGAARVFEVYAVLEIPE